MVIEFKVFSIRSTFSDCSVEDYGFLTFISLSLLRPLCFTGGLFSRSIVGLKTATDNLLLITDHKFSIGLNAEHLAVYVNTDSKSSLKSGPSSYINIKLL